MKNIPHYRGITWDHPRGFKALAAAADMRRDVDGVVIEWDKQPLEGFESHPIADLCARYDLIIMDHPHLGEAYDAGCLIALEDIFSQKDLTVITQAAVGACAKSYLLHDRHWALPIDAATQVSAYRADLLSSAPPVTWGEVIKVARTSGKVALSLAGPHAFLSFLSICVAFDEKDVCAQEGMLVKPQTGNEAYKLMQQLMLYAPTSVVHCNPIGILEHMTHFDDVALCPLIYGYVTYAAPTNLPKPLHFTNAPCQTPGGKIGTILGGTGVAISKKCQISEGLKRHLMWLMSDTAQTSFIPFNQGQPSGRTAWQDEIVNQQVNNFYRNTLSSLDAAYIRPRYRGFIAFQTQASHLLRHALMTGQKGEDVVDALNQLFCQSII